VAIALSERRASIGLSPVAVVGAEGNVIRPSEFYARHYNGRPVAVIRKKEDSMKTILVALLIAVIVAVVGGCATPTTTPVRSGRLLLSGNDGKFPYVNGGYRVADPATPDTLTVFDVSVFPPRKLSEIEIQHTVTAPPMTIAITADEKLALVSAPNRVDPKDKTKVVTDNYMQIVDLEASPPRIIDRVDLGRHPLGVSVNRAGTLALAAHMDGNISVLAIQGKSVKFVETIKIGEPVSSPRQVAITPDGKWALAAKRGEDMVAVLAIDGTKVTYTKRDITVGNNPYGLEISNDGRFAAVANIGRGDGSSDSVTLIDLTRQPFRAVDHFAVGQTPEGIAISPDSQWIVVHNIHGSNKTSDSPFRTESGRVMLFAVKDGKSSKVGEAPTGGHNGQGVSFTPDGKYVVVQNYVEKELVFYRVSASGIDDTGLRVPVPGHPAGLRIAP
jgi:DNA-binding beta-propeller fold protein YncE